MISYLEAVREVAEQIQRVAVGGSKIGGRVVREYGLFNEGFQILNFCM
jgi:hypothetical protein